MRYEGKEYDCTLVQFQGMDLIFRTNLKDGEASSARPCAAIGVTEMGVMVTMHDGTLEMFEGIPYRANFVERKADEEVAN